MLRRAKSRRLEPIGGILAEALDRLGLSAQVREYQAVGIWDRTVGEPTCRHTRAWAIENGVLIVLADSHVWIQELTFLKSDILRRLNERLGGEIVKDIRFRPMSRRQGT
jgi:predicted nucleic acid-binding Zn ribbon protein